MKIITLINEYLEKIAEISSLEDAQELDFEDEMSLEDNILYDTTSNQIQDPEYWEFKIKN
mgnify:CR=1 FL=1